MGPALSIASAPLHPSPPALCQPYAHPRLRRNACWCCFHGALIDSLLSPCWSGGKQVIFSNYPGWKESPLAWRGCLGPPPACVRPSIPASTSQHGWHCAPSVPEQRLPRTWEQRGADAGTTHLHLGAETILPSPIPLLPILASSAGPGGPGRTDPSHGGLQGGTSSFVYLKASLTNEQSLSSGLPRTQPQSNVAGKRRGAPRRTQSMWLCAHVCMRVRAGGPDNEEGNSHCCSTGLRAPTPYAGKTGPRVYVRHGAFSAIICPRPHNSLASMRAGVPCPPTHPLHCSGLPGGAHGQDGHGDGQLCGRMGWQLGDAAVTAGVDGQRGDVQPGNAVHLP